MILSVRSVIHPSLVAVGNVAAVMRTEKAGAAELAIQLRAG